VSEYGNCPCGGVYSEKRVQVTINTDQPVVIDDVPQGACPSCRSRVYSAAVIGRLEATLKRLPWSVAPAGFPSSYFPRNNS
jgi:hypothetical protein